MEKTGCKIICGAPTTLAVKGLIMMMMMISVLFVLSQNMCRCTHVFAVKLCRQGDDDLSQTRPSALSWRQIKTKELVGWFGPSSGDEKIIAQRERSLVAVCGVALGACLFSTRSVFPKVHGLTGL